MSTEILFRSKVLHKALGFLVANKGKAFFVREIARKIKADPGAVQRELKRLEAGGWVLSRMEGRNKYFQVDKTNPLLDPLEKLLDPEVALAGETLVVAYEEPWTSPLTLSSNANGWPGLRQDKRFLRQDIGNTAVVYTGDYFKFAVDIEKMSRAGLEINERIKKKEYVLGNQRAMEELALRMLPLIRELTRAEEVDADFAKKLEKVFDMGIELCQLGYIGPLTDFAEPYLSRKMKEIATARSEGKELGFTPQQIVNLLNSPIKLSLTAEREKRLLELAGKVLKVRKGRKDMKTVKEVLKDEAGDYYQDFYWTSFGHYGFEKNPEEAFREVKDILDNYDLARIRERTRELEGYEKETARKKENLIKKLGLNREEANIFHSAAVLAYLKGVRQELLSGINSQIRIFIEAIEKTQGVKKEDLWRGSMDEVLEIFHSGASKEKIKELKDREKLAVWIISDKIRGEKILSGQPAKEFIKEHIREQEKEIDDRESFHGMAAYPGKARGKVVIVQTAKDLERVGAGDVLVAQQTVPEMVPAMKIAAAFVTNIGGITCHAAIMAREFKKPCIVGTKVATRILKNGDLVEVDADKGTVKIIKINLE